MKNIILAGLMLVSGLACQGTTSVGGADAGCDVTIPKDGFLGPNILYMGNDSFQGQPAPQLQLYELVVTHDVSANVRVKMTLLSGNPWSIPGSANDWHVTLFDSTSNSQMFEAPNVTGEFEEALYFDYTGTARVDLFECGATTPSLSKTISWSSPDVPPDDGGPGFPPDGGFPLDATVNDDASPVPTDGGPIFLGDDAGLLIPRDASVDILPLP
jgi:hypothetical protein